MSTLRSSASKADVRLERKLRYEFAKLKAKGQLRSLYRTQYAKTSCWSNHNCFDYAGSRGSLDVDERALHPHTYWWEALGCKRTRSATLKNVNGTALDQSVTERKKLQEKLDQVQRAHEQSSTELDQLREKMNRLGWINSVDKRLRKVVYNLPHLDGQVELLTKMQLSGTTSLPQTQVPSGPREKGHDMA
uniref:Uncharacterized protein n=1 Tax=Hyaloperonospora arabidopsidis (strain Emoy2) TaxID=559515 RepID=M4BW59_HYAAE